MNDAQNKMTGWPKATTKRRLLAVYIDFICFNAFWGLVVWALSRLIPSIQNANDVIKYGFFILSELILFRFIRWSPGNDFLGIHIRFSPEYLKTQQPSFLSSDLAVEPYLISRERWWTILFGVIALLEGLKTLVRWTMYAVSIPFFGFQTSTMESIIISLFFGIIECFIGIAALRLHKYVLPLGTALYGATTISMFLSLSLIPGWIEASAHARRSFQGINVRPGEIEFMQSIAPLLIVWPIVLLVWTVFIYFKSK